MVTHRLPCFSYNFYLLANSTCWPLSLFFLLANSMCWPVSFLLFFTGQLNVLAYLIFFTGQLNVLAYYNAARWISLAFC